MRRILFALMAVCMLSAASVAPAFADGVGDSPLVPIMSVAPLNLAWD